MNIKYRELILFIAILFQSVIFTFRPLEASYFYSGLTYSFFEPEKILLILILVLVTFQQAAIQPNKALISFSVGLLFSTLLGLFDIVALNINYSLLLLAVTCIIGLLSIIQLTINHKLIYFVNFIAGMLVAASVISDLLSTAENLGRILIITGFLVSNILIWPYLFGVLRQYLNSEYWHSIAVRVVASWVVTISALVLALNFASA